MGSVLWRDAADARRKTRRFTARGGRRADDAALRARCAPLPKPLLHPSRQHHAVKARPNHNHTSYTPTHLQKAPPRRREGPGLGARPQAAPGRAAAAHQLPAAAATAAAADRHGRGELNEEAQCVAADCSLACLPACLSRTNTGRSRATPLARIRTPALCLTLTLTLIHITLFIFTHSRGTRRRSAAAATSC